VTKWAERSDAVFAIVVSYSCATLRAVSKPCQYSILADYLLSADRVLMVYPKAMYRALTRYWTYIEIATKIVKGTKRSNTDERLGRTGGRIVWRGEAETLRFPACR